MATGKNAAEPVEEKPAAPEAVEQPQAAETSVAVEAAPEAEAAPEVAVSEAQAEAPAEAVAESPVENVAAAPAQEEAVDERPFHEPATDAPAEVAVEAASAPVVEEAAPVEAAPEAAAEESAPVEEAAPVEAAPEAVAESALPATEEGLDERPFHEETTEAPAEEAKAAEETASEGAATEEAKADEESAGEEAGETKEDAAGEEAGPASEMRWGQETPVGGWMSSQRRQRKLPLPDDGDRGSLTTEEYRRLKAERRRSGTDVVPSPEETSYLKMGRTSEEVTEQELRRMSQDPMWKTLVQFKGWLPVVTSLLPVLDMASGRSESGGSAEMKDTMDGLLMSHRDVRATLQNQTAELKRVEEEVAKLRDAADKTAFEQTAMSDDVRSMQRLVKSASLYLGILLGLLVAVVGYMAFLVFSYLNHPVH
ncbi:MAG: hypothetical protein ACP5M4_15295 [Acidobacteriaceae bacterium]